MGKAHKKRRDGVQRGRRAPGIVDMGSVRTVAEARSEEQDQSAKPKPCIVDKLTNEDAAVREAACQDASALLLDSAQRTKLMELHVEVPLRACLSDANIEVRTAAATAIRNYITVVEMDAAVDQFVDQELLNTILATIEEAFPTTARVDADESYKQKCIRLLNEELGLCGVLAEASEFATTTLSQAPGFLSTVVECLAQEDIGVTASECLHVMSVENDVLAEFVAQDLTAEQQRFLNDMATVPPTSPALLVTATHLCGVLLNTSASSVNCRNVMPVLVAALDTPPSQIVRRELSFLSVESTLPPALRKEGVQQCEYRLQAMQTAADVLHDVISFVADFQDSSLPDEEAFFQNPEAAILSQFGVIAKIVAATADLINPIRDVVLDNALRDSTTDYNTAHLQQLYTSIEVGMLGLCSSLLMFVPLESFGSPRDLWFAATSAIAERLRILSIGSFSWPMHLSLQNESLTEMCWTLQRRDAAGATQPQGGDLDLLTRCAWETSTTPSSRVFIVGAVGCISCRARNSDMTYASANFCLRMMAAALGELQTPSNRRVSSGEEDAVEIAAECANVLIDLFSDEDFDQTALIPLGVLGALQNTIEALAPFTKKTRKALYAHVDEVTTNLRGFLEYKANLGLQW